LLAPASARYEVNNKQANIDPVTKQIEYAGKNGNSRALYNANWTQFELRIGFAWQPDSCIADANFGQITNVVSNPRLLQLSLKYEF
jgi:hypothetical protein